MTSPEAGRDYQADMLAVIEAAIPEGGFVSALIAAELVEKLEATDPDLLAGWLRQRAAVILTQVITARANRERATAHSRSGSRAFRNAADAFEQDGDAGHLSVFLAVHTINDQNDKKPIGAMGPADWAYVASDYTERAKQNSMEAAFAKAIQKRLIREKASRTDEVFTEQQYLDMYRSITHREPQAAAA